MHNTPGYVVQNYKDCIRNHFKAVAKIDGAVVNLQKDRALYREIRSKSLDALTSIEAEDSLVNRNKIFTDLRNSRGQVNSYVHNVVAYTFEQMRANGTSRHAPVAAPEIS